LHILKPREKDLSKAIPLSLISAREELCGRLFVPRRFRTADAHRLGLPFTFISDFIQKNINTTSHLFHRIGA
jgi:hypothetical protein